MRIDVTLPRWSPPPTASAALVAEWESYVAALERHEDGHRDLAIDAARAVEAALSALPAFPSAEELAIAVSSTTEGAVAAARAREEAYDARTRHGLADGVRPPSEPVA